MYSERTVVVANSQSQVVPALLSFFCFSGLGQLVQGRLLAAIIWFTLDFLAALSCFIFIGFILVPIVRIACVIDAAMYSPPIVTITTGGYPSAGAAAPPSSGFPVLLAVGAVAIVMFLGGAVLLLGLIAGLSGSGTSEVATVNQQRQASPPAPQRRRSPEKLDQSQSERQAGESGLIPLGSPDASNDESTNDIEPKSPPLSGDPSAASGADSADRAAPESTLPGVPGVDAKDEIGPGSAGPRFWTDASGQFRIQAALLSANSWEVRLKKTDETQIQIPLTSLSQDDLQYVAEATGIDAVNVAQMRPWTSNSGTFSVKAILLARDGDTIKLKKEDGSVVDVPIAVLGKSELAFVESMSDGFVEPRADTANSAVANIKLIGGYNKGTKYWNCFLIPTDLSEEQLIQLASQIFKEYPGKPFRLFDDDSKYEEYKLWDQNYPNSRYPYPEAWVVEHYRAMGNQMFDLDAKRLRWQLSTFDGVKIADLE